MENIDKNTTNDISEERGISEIINLSNPTRINGKKEEKERLNLTKYAFLDYLKGDVFAWLNCNQNYQQASKEDEKLRLSTPWRYKEEDQGDDFDVDAYYEKMRFDIRDDSIDWKSESPDQIKAGIRVGEYSEIWAKQNWPNHEVKSIEGYGIELENVIETKQLLDKYENLVLFEAEFTYNEFKTRTDILVKTGDKVEIIEVKGSGSPKLLYGFDLLFQRAIIEKSNPEYKNWDYSLLLLDRLYQHNSKWSKEEVAERVFTRTWKVTNCDNLGSKKIPELDPSEATKWNRISDPYFSNTLVDWITFEEQPIWGNPTGRSKNFTFTFEEFYNSYAVQELLNNFDDVLATIKEIQLLENPPLLEFEDRNNKFMSSDYMQWALAKSGAYGDGDIEDSIFDFKGTKFNWKTKCALFKKDIKRMGDVPIEEMVPGNLVSSVSGKSDEMAILDFLQLEGTKNASGYSAIIQRAYLNKDDFLLHRERLYEDLARYDKGPIYMYDFETANLAIPEVHMAKPYEQVVYQYSIHVILDPKDYDFETMKNIIHYEWLAEDRDTFHLDAWNNFAKVFEKHGKGVYAAWNMSFEKTCIKNALNNWEFEQNVTDWMVEVRENTIDLMESFKYKFYYHKELKGSYSIKFAGPHFAEEINYKDLPLVQRGDQSAAVAKMWLRAKGQDSDKEWNSRRSGMLKYCEYDTLLMVAILQRLQERVKPSYQRKQIQEMEEI